MSSADPAASRKASLAWLAAVELELPRELPLLEAPEGKLDLGRILDRALALNAVIAASYGLPRADAAAWLRRQGLEGALSAGEVAYLETGDEAARARIRFEVEAVQALVWCSEHVDALDFRMPCDDALVALFPDLGGDGRDSPAPFRRAAVARPVGEVLAAADLAYLLDWLHVQARLDRRPPPAGVVGHDVVEHRRRALDWTLWPQPWDEVSLDT